MNDTNKWFLLSLTALIGWLIYRLSPVLTPFVISAILAYLGDPLTDKLETYKLSRIQAVCVVFFAMTLAILLIFISIVPSLEEQISGMIVNLPTYATNFNNNVIPWLEQRLKIDLKPVEFDKLVEILNGHWQKTGGLVSGMMSSVGHSGSVIVTWLMNLLLIPVVTFYLLRDWDILVAKIYELLPRRIAPTAAKLANEVNSVLSAFLRGQFYVMLALGGVYSVGLSLAGLDLALLIGMSAGLISFVPYLGATVGIVSATIAAIVQFHDASALLPVAGVFLIGQVLEGTVLTPKLVGDKIGLHPVAVIFSVMAGGQLFGFIGILIALPVASVIMVFLRHVHDIYRDSEFYGKDTSS